MDITVSQIYYCLIVVNIITFLLFGIDKWKAVHNRWRIREATLLGLCLIGGAAGGWLGMQVFRHKTKKAKFAVGVPVMLVLQVVLFVYLHKG